MNDMLKAYAHQVASYHPAAQRDDLFAEVYDELCEEFSDWQSQHPGGDATAFLNDCRPHPMKYATSLAESGAAYLVGPQFYFSFLSALKVSLAIVVVVYLLIAAVSVLTGSSVMRALLNMISALPITMLWVGAAVLGVFVALEKSGERATWLDDWNASELKPADSHQEISRFETSFDLALSTFLLLWVLNVVRMPAAVRHDGEWITDFTVNLPDAAWLIMGLLLAFDIAYSLYRLGRRLWTPRLRLLTVANNVAWLVLLAFVVSQPDLVTVGHEGASEFLVIVDKAFRGGLLVVFAIVAWDTVTHAWRLFRRGG